MIRILIYLFIALNLFSCNCNEDDNEKDLDREALINKEKIEENENENKDKLFKAIEAYAIKKYNITYSWDTLNYNYSNDYYKVLKSKFQLFSQYTVTDYYLKDKKEYLSIIINQNNNKYFDLEVSKEQAKKVFDKSFDVIFVVSIEELKKIKIKQNYENQGDDDVYFYLDESDDFIGKGKIIDVIPISQTSLPENEESRILIPKGKLVLKIQNDVPVSCIQISPDKKIVAISDKKTEADIFNEVENKRFNIKILESNSKYEKFVLKGHSDEITSINFSPDSKRLLSTDTKGNIIIWDLINGRKVKQIETNEWVGKARFINEGKEIIASQDFAKVALVYNLEGELLQKLKINNEIRDFEINFNTKEILFICHKEIQKWSLTSMKKIKNISIININCIKFSPDYKRIAMGDYDGNIFIMTENLDVVFKLEGHFNTILSLSFSFDGELLASGSSDQTARIWNLEEQKEIIQLTNIHKGRVSAIEFISGLNLFMTGGEREEILIWE